MRFSIEKMLAHWRAESEIAGICRHRSLLWIAGEEKAGVALCFDLFELNTSEERTEQQAEQSPILWIGERAPTRARQTNNRGALNQLGTENDLVVLNTHTGFDSDALAACAGTVRAGGCLVLLSPEPDLWPSLDHEEKRRVTVEGYNPASESRFVKRFCQQLTAHSRALATIAIPDHGPVSIRLLKTTASDTQAEITCGNDSGSAIPASTRQEQEIVVEELKQHLSSAIDNNQSLVCVLTADRGRGKSVALGQLAARISKHTKIIVTAPTRRSAGILINHYKQLSHESLEFESPDSLLNKLAQTGNQGSLLLIDEAAAIPLPVLNALVTSFPLVVMATTVHGYEGAGRGFAIKFKTCLSENHRTASWHTLQKPIRWNDNDPLEAFLNTCLLLNSDPANTECNIASSPPASADNPVVSKIDRSQLLEDEQLLRGIYSVLLQAHYQTRPMDLRHIMDGENLDILAMKSAGQIVATALVAREGPISEAALRNGIMQKTRRPRGHLLVQLLAQSTLRESVLDLRIARIVRIAVLPGLQNRGLGSQLVSELLAHYKQQTDALGAMYGSHPDLDRFWSRAGFHAVHRGYKKNQASGLHSVAVIRPVTGKAESLATRARRFYLRNIDYDKRFTHSQTVSPASSHSADLTMEPDDVELIRAYCRKRRSLFETRPSLQAVCAVWRDEDQFTDPQLLSLLELCINTQLNNESLVEALQVSGKTEAEHVFRLKLQFMLEKSTVGRHLNSTSSN